MTALTVTSAWQTPKAHGSGLGGKHFGLIEEVITEHLAKNLEVRE